MTSATPPATTATARLPREVFTTLAAVAWADGALDPAEADAITRAAREAGLDPSEIEAVAAAMRAPVALADVDYAALSPEDRLYVYAVALWVATLDGTTTERERAVVDVLGFALRLTPRGRAVVDDAVRALTQTEDARRPARFDLEGLRAALDAKLREASGAR